MRERTPALCRRGWLLGGSFTSLALAASVSTRTMASTPLDGPITQPPAPGPAASMARAFDMKRLAERGGDQSFGAVVARADRIVGLGPSAVITRGDPTAHAEMEAIRDAARRLGTRALTGCVLYSTSRPCPMCEAAAAWAGIERLIHGEQLVDAGVPRVTRC